MFSEVEYNLTLAYFFFYHLFLLTARSDESEMKLQTLLADSFGLCDDCFVSMLVESQGVFQPVHNKLVFVFNVS